MKIHYSYKSVRSFKKFLLLIAVLTMQLSLKAQLNCKTILNGELSTTSCFHANGKLSTITKKLSSSPHWYLVKIYNSLGQELYSREYGQKWGSSGVTLKYHDNGQVKSVQYTMQPDGGIQRTDVTTFYTENGAFEREEDRSWGRNGMPEITVPVEWSLKSPVVSPTEKTPAIVECAPVQMPFDFYIINHTSNPLKITAFNQQSYGQRVSRNVYAGDSVLIETYYAKPESPNPLNFYKVEIKNKPKRGYSFQIKETGATNESKQYISVSLKRVRK